MAVAGSGSRVGTRRPAARQYPAAAEASSQSHRAEILAVVCSSAITSARTRSRRGAGRLPEGVMCGGPRHTES